MTMGRPAHPVTKRIREAAADLERLGVTVTPDAVQINVEKRLTWADWSPDEAKAEALRVRITREMKEMGYVIADGATHTRKNFWSAGIAELEEQKRVKQASSQFDRARIACDEAVIAFLREKQKDFGYEVYPGLFHAEIDRIHSMHGFSSPGGAA